MSENTLLAKITAQTDAQIADIKAKAEADALALQRETEQRIAQLQHDASHELEKKKRQQEVVGVSKARQAANIALQQAKRTAVDVAFAKVFTDLKNLPAAEYVKLFSKLTVNSLPAGVEVVRVVAPVNRATETQEILQSINQASATVVSDAALAGGMLVESTSGVYDITLTRLFNEKRAALEIEIVNLALA